MDRGARWGRKEWDTIEHTHHYSLDQQSRPYFAGFSTSESHLKASTKVLAWAAVSLGVSAGEKNPLPGSRDLAASQLRL